MYLLDPVIRPYAWGATHAISDLLGRTPSGGPEAELWVGAHPGAPSQVILPDGGRRGLDEVIGEDPRTLLGEDVADRFEGRLPFLLKVLAAGSALSLQVHPSLEQAGTGYDAEEAAGIPADAPNRNYRDRNHKPEMIFALTPFEALCGFRPFAESVGILTFLASVLDHGSRSRELLESATDHLAADGGLPAAFRILLEAPTKVVGEITAAAGRLLDAGEHEPGVDDAVRPDLGTVRELGSQYPGDPGVLVALLLNRVALQPGEALYLPAGNVHAYLGGLGIEVMAASDNVLRGGLTPKHVDTSELLSTVAFETLAPPSLTAEHTLLDQELYRPPFEEFALQRIVLGGTIAEDGEPAGTADVHVPVVQNGPVVVLAVSGPILLDTPKGTLTVPRGGSAFVGAGEAPLIVRPAADDAGATDGPVLAFAVTVGGDSPAL